MFLKLRPVPIAVNKVGKVPKVSMGVIDNSYSGDSDQWMMPVMNHILYM